MKIKFINPFKPLFDHFKLNKNPVKFDNISANSEVYVEVTDIFGQKVRVLKEAVDSRNDFDKNYATNFQIKKYPFEWFYSPARVLVGVNIFVYLLPSFLGYGFNLGSSNYQFLALFWKDTALILQGQWWRLLTSIFLHADFFHLAFNMLTLWQITPSVVQFIGKKGFWVVYFISGVIGSLASVYLSPLTKSVGASGAIFGLIGALVIISIKIKNKSLLNNLVFIIFINFIYSLNPFVRIDNWGHLGGLVAGFVVACFLKIKADTNRYMYS